MIMKSVIFILSIVCCSVFAAPNYQEYAKEVSTKENMAKLQEMEKACKPVNNKPSDMKKCKELAEWQRKLQCKHSIIDKKECK